MRPAGYGPADFQAAYALPSNVAGIGERIYVIDAYDDPTAESDLSTYRAQYGLPACTSTNKCFHKENQFGNPSPLPTRDAGWAQEISLDLDMVSAACPNCDITLVEAFQDPTVDPLNEENEVDLLEAVQTATNQGARFVSMSFGFPEELLVDQGMTTSYLNVPGVTYVAASGDSDYAGGVLFPSASQNVVAVGGTKLVPDGDGRWTETVWNNKPGLGTGSGCSENKISKPSWQSIIPDSVCSDRAVADVSADADPTTGAAVYETYGGKGWGESGGTSEAAPLIASMYALAGDPSATDKPPSFPYSHTADLYDVTSGNNGSCTPSRLCTAGAGWDGPTGLGSPRGIAAFIPPAPSGGGGGGGGGGGTQLSASSTTLTASINPARFGQVVTLNVAVRSTAGTPTGSVSIYDGPKRLTTRALRSGDSSLSISTLTPGTHELAAIYGGDGSYASSRSVTLGLVVLKAATNTALQSSANPAVYCQSVTFPSQVSVQPPGAGLPTGAVNYYDGGTQFGADNLDNAASASVSTQFFTIGTHPITASYQGDQDFLSSTSAVLQQVVNRAPTVTTLTSDPNGTNGFGHTSTFDATVSVPPPGCGTPTGDVQFAVDSTPVYTAPLSTSLTASMSTTALLPGTHVVSATYSGDDHFLSSYGTVNYLVTCTRTLSGRLYGSIAASGDSTCIVNGQLSGSVYVPAGVKFALVNSTVYGTFLADSTAGVGQIAICGSQVDATTIIDSAHGPVMVGDPAAVCPVNTFGSALIVTNDIYGANVVENTVFNLYASNLSGPGPYPGQSSGVSGNTGPAHGSNGGVKSVLGSSR